MRDVGASIRCALMKVHCIIKLSKLVVVMVIFSSPCSLKRYPYRKFDKNKISCVLHEIQWRNVKCIFSPEASKYLSHTKSLFFHTSKCIYLTICAIIESNTSKNKYPCRPDDILKYYFILCCVYLCYYNKLKIHLKYMKIKCF